MKVRFLIFSIIGILLFGVITFETTYCFMTFGETIEISFETNGGENIDNIIYSYGINSLTNKLPIPKKDGYLFDGWYLENTYDTEVKSVPFPEFSNNEVITLYAKWDNQDTSNDNHILNNYIKYGILTLFLIIFVFCLFLIRKKKYRDK